MGNCLNVANDPSANFLETRGFSLFFHAADRFLAKKGHLCLWREDSLKEKYNTKYYKTYFY